MEDKGMGMRDFNCQWVKYTTVAWYADITRRHYERDKLQMSFICTSNKNIYIDNFKRG